MGGMTMMGGGMGMMPMMGMGGMGMMPGMMPMMIMGQMMQLMQMLMMLMGQQQGGGMGGGMGGFPGGGCGCDPGIGPAMGNGYGFPGGGGGGGGYGMPYGGGNPGYGGGGYGGGDPFGGGYGCGPTGPLPYNQQTGNRLADTAASWAGRSFKPGQTKRCADFVSTMLEQSGTAPPGFRHQESAAGLANYGRPVDQQNMKPGDVVFFGNTYRPGRYTHVGVYLGNGRFAHRPTANKPVKIDNLNSPYWQQHFTGGRRMQG